MPVSLRLRYPNALPVAVAGLRVARVGIRLLHGAVGVEDVHVVAKRRVGVVYEPRADDGVSLAAWEGKEDEEDDV